MLCVQEPCRTVKLARGKERPRLIFAKRPQRVPYYYFVDRGFGLMYIRLEAWFPHAVQIYIHGHEGLARQITKRGMFFTPVDNAFVRIDDFPEGQ